MNEEITLTDLFEVEMLQRIQDSFSKMTGIAALITDANGKPVTKGACFTDFCDNYTRKSMIGCLRCEQCDKHGAELALKVGASVTYYCHAGLMDFAAPIMAGDKMIGCFVGGQVLTEPPDITKVMQVAAELDIELISYLQAALKVPVIAKSQLENAANFLYTLTDALSSIAYHKYMMHQANIEIEKVANMKSDFLANMSHEIRTPMNAVIGMAEMALREDLTPTAREYISQIKSSGKTLLTIINDILDFSKIEAGKMDIVEVEYEPMSLINDITSIINTRINTDSVEFILNINPNIPARLFGDNIRIKQIITNICNNAAKFTKAGQIILKVDYRKMDKDHIELQISVSDTGIGIKEEDRAKLFQSFQQLDSKRNRNIEGTGLGLAISKKLLDLMNGDIKAESVYGEGSTFSFWLPQKIMDNTTAITIKQEPIITYSYIENPYVQTQLHSDIIRLGLEYNSLPTLGRSKKLPDIPSDKKAYLFIEDKLFTARLQKLVKEQPALTAVILINFDASVKYDIENVIVMKKPISTISLAALFNNEATPLEDTQNPDDSFDFTAPDAKILIVDDNAINLTVAEGLLEPLCMHIDTALSGQEALTKITEEKYDLILMDHMMPEIDGVETTHLIRRFHEDYADVPIIALSANAVSGAKEMFIEEGMNDFVAKPIEVRMLVPKIKQWLPKSKIKRAGAGKRTKRTTDKEAVNHSTASQASTIHIEGLDTEIALSLLGTEKLFWSVLKDYYRAIPKKLENIKKFEAEEDFKNYTIEVHALKSSSKQIGAIELSDKALALEKAGNEQDAATIHANTDELLALYQKYRDILKPYFPEEEKKNEGSTPITPEILATAFTHMVAAIDDLDMDKMEAVAKELEPYQYEGKQEELYKNFCDAVENIDVDTCEAIMKEWKALVGLPE